ncbi:MAG TPA: M14 family metallocarboxypeptidase [Candidatus Kapabacteria bacterium]|nr:M14 family metallocarboxypeptidase [Candidatus Kapabacteria bacterium]
MQQRIVQRCRGGRVGDGLMERLGKNQGRYHGETIDIDKVQREIRAAAELHGWQSEIFYKSIGAELCGYHRTSRSAKQNVYLSSGIHGDEPAGPLAILELLRSNEWPEANLWLVPCVNPNGFRLNTRENAEGVDLNRDYRHQNSTEVRAQVEWLKRQPDFDLTLILHEDWESNGFYVYELNPNDRRSLAEDIVEAVREVCPIETAELVDNWECRAGIIRPQVDPTERPQWAESVWLIVNKTAQSYTLETPSDFSLESRVRAHLAAVRGALRSFLRK